MIATRFKEVPPNAAAIHSDCEVSCKAETESVVNGASDSAFASPNERRRIVSANREPASRVAGIDLYEWSSFRGEL